MQEFLLEKKQVVEHQITAKCEKSRHLRLMILVHSKYGKMQESEFTEIIPQICILAIQGQYPVFLHPDIPLSWTVDVGYSGDELMAGNIRCLPERQAACFVY